MKRKSLLFLCVLMLFLTACGKKAKTTETTQPPKQVDMIFVPAQDSVTAKEECNLRDYPSQDERSEVIHKLLNGEVVTRTGISDTGWSELSFDGTVCYAVSSYLTTDLDYKPPVTEQTEAPVQEDGINTPFTTVVDEVTAKDVVNLRSLPSVTSEESVILGQLQKGEVLKRIGVSENGWSKLIYQDWVVYAVSSYLTANLDYEGAGELLPEDPGIQTRFYAHDDMVTPKIEVNLRTKPSVTDPDAVVAYTVKKGTAIHRTGINEDVGWSRVEYEGTVLYCVSQYLEPYQG